MKRLSSFFSALLISIVSLASSYQFIRFNTGNSGLSYDGISKIFQDSRGFIWIGTFKGLNRYDGSTFKVYDKVALGLSSDFIFSIKEDKAGDLWIGTDAGVTKYDYARDCFEPLTLKSDKGSSIRNKVTFIDVDGDGTVWMLVNDQGVFRYFPNTGDLRHNPYTNFNDVIGFRKMLKLSDGDLLFSCYHLNLFQADSNFGNFRPIDLAMQSDYFLTDEIEGLFEGEDGNIYVASTKHGISLMNLSKKTVKQLFSLPDGVTLTDVFFEDGRRFWLSTDKGVFIYDRITDESEFFCEDKDDRFSLSGNYVWTTIVDCDGGIWVGTKDGGVSYCGTYQNNFEKQYKAGGRPLDGVIVSGFVSDGGSRLWATTEQVGLLEYDIERHVTKRLLEGKLPRTLCSPCYSAPYLWLGSLEGLFRVDTRDYSVKSYGVLKRSSGVNDPRVYLVGKTSSEDMIVGTTLGIFIYDRSTDLFHEVAPFDGVFVTGFAEDADGKLWISTYAKGVYLWDFRSGALPVHFSAEGGSGLEGNKIASVFVDSNNRVWTVGFSHGISCFDRERCKFVKFNLEVLPSDVCFKMVEDQEGQLWVTTDCGLLQIDPKSKECRLYSQFDGLLDNKLTNSACSIRGGDMFFGSDNGFIRVNPSKLYAEVSSPKIVITKMKVADKYVDTGCNIDLSTEVKLAKNENSFGFDFSVLGVSLPAFLRVQCMLEGHDDEGWKDVLSSRSVFYYNVPPGTYLLRMRCSLQNGGWIDAHAPLKIVVSPGFWASSIGIMCIVGIIVMLFAIVVFLERKMEEKKRRDEAESYRREKDEEMFQEKMNFFSHVIHEIKTPLTLIKTPLGNVITKNEIDEEARHDLEVMQNSTDYLSRLVNELLDFVRIEKQGYSLHLEPIDVVERLHSLVFDFTDTARNSNISLSFDCAEKSAIVSADSSALDKMLNNLLLNAVKYAESRIIVSLSCQTGRLEVAISNDGPSISFSMRDEIFKPFVQGQAGSKNGSSGVGIGLPLARDLAQMHSGDLVLDTSADLTTFVLSLPLSEDVADDSVKEETGSSEFEKPRLLIADDNKDLREYLATKLGEQYDVLAVSNGDAALRMVCEQNIDFLLTDISMPGKNGLELCREIRENLDVSHLPIIILSARASVQSKIQAMEAGADLYIEKPFDLEYLKSSIHNILDRRQLMRNAFSNGVISSGIDIFGLPKKDEEFFSRFDSVIRDNLSNPELNVEFLSEALAVSQSTLTRKIKKLLDTTPNNYVRSIRLAVAAEMLRDSHGNNISEICYTVGFSSLSYFSKCFKEQYGKIPTDYASDQ